MGALAEMPVPVTGQLAALPTPDVAPVDVSQVASPTQRGFRSGMNQVGAAVSNLAGQAGVTLGLSKFAEDRFKDAAEYTAKVDTDGVQDWGSVKDFTDLTHYVGHLIGSTTATMAPAVGLSLGLRRPVAGTMLGLAPIEAGNQVERLNADPVAKAAGPQAVLRNAVVTGTGIAALNAVGGGAPTQLAKRALGQEVAGSLGKAVAKDAALNAAINPASDVAAQAMHQQLNPDKQIDTSNLTREALEGAAVGGTFGAAGHAVGKVPSGVESLAKSAGELRDRFKRQSAPADAMADLPPESVNTPEDVMNWMKENEQKVTDFLGSRWDDVKNSGAWKDANEFIKDPEVRAAAADNLKQQWNDSQIKPVIEGVGKYVKDFVERLAAKHQKKYSLMGNKVDYDQVGQDILNQKPVYVYGQNKELADLLIKHGYGEKEPGRWEPVIRKKSEQRTAKDDQILDAVVGNLPEDFRLSAKPEQLQELATMVRTLAEDPEHFNESGVPHTLHRVLGDKFETMMGDVAKVLEKDAPTKAFAAKRAQDGEYTKAAQDIVRNYARPHYIVDKGMRDVLLNEIAPRMIDRIHGVGGDEAFHRDMQQVFGPDTDKAYAALDKIKPQRESAAFEAKDANEQGATGDARLNQVFNATKAGFAKAQRVIDELEAEYGKKNMRVQMEQVGDYVGLRAEPRDQVGLDKAAWDRVREPEEHNKSGLENGILTVQKATGGHQNKINLMRLTSEMMRTEKGTGRNYLLDMFNRGMSTLLNSEDFKDVKGLRKADGSWDIPAKTPVAVQGGKIYTYGQLKEASLPQSHAAIALRQRVREAAAGPERQAALKRLSNYYDNQRSARESVEAMEQDALLQLHDEGPSAAREIFDPELNRYRGDDSHVQDATQAMRDRLQDENAQIRQLRDDVQRIEAEGKEHGLRKDMIDQQVQEIAREIGPHLRLAAYLRRSIENVEKEAERMRSQEPDLEELGSAGQQAATPEQVEKQNTLRGQDAPGERKYQEETGLPLDGEPAAGPKSEPDVTAVTTSHTDVNALREEWKTASPDRKAEIEAEVAKATAPIERKSQDAPPVERLPRREHQTVDPDERLRAEDARIAEDGMTDATRANLGRSMERITKTKMSDSALERRRANMAKWDKDVKKFSTENIARGDKIDKETMKAVGDYVKKVLGDKADVFFTKLDNAGDFAKLNGVETLRIAIDAINPMSVAHHEAVHAFLARLIKADPKAAHTLMRAASSAPVVARLHELLKGHDKAIAQLKDPEERLAYMYQFWAAGEKGLLNVGPETKGWFDKVKGFFRKVAAIWADESMTADDVERAGDILAAFHRGDFANPNTVAEVLRDRFPRSAYEAAQHMMPWLDNLMNKFVWTSSGAVRDLGIEPLSQIMDKFHTTTGAQGDKVGFLQAKNAAYNRFVNRVSDVFKSMPTAERQRLVWEDLHTGRAAETPEGKAIRAILKDIRDYAVLKGVKLVSTDKNGKVTMEPIGNVEHYFPRVPDQDVLNTAEGKQAFLDLLKKHGVKEPEKTWQNWASTNNPKVEDASVGLTFFTPATLKRSLGDIPEAELAPFLNKDLFGSLSQYASRMTRRAEYTERFGNIGEEIDAAKAAAKEFGMTPEQEKTFDSSVKAMSGTLGADLDPKLKHVYSGLMTYQNVRLLPLQLFSSFVDPLGIAVRGGTLKEAGLAFAKGLRDLVKLNPDAAMELAKTVGSINAADQAGLMSELYGSEYMPKLQRSINDKFFRFTGMEKWNNRMRAQATVAAEHFIDRHMNRPTQHSERYLAELGLKKGDKLDVSNPQYVQALNKWVDEAIIRPNAAHRPVYMSDPHWMLISHLKQYTYLFQKTILSRAYHEIQHGNFHPAMVLASYVPAMIAADMMKVNLTPGGADNDARAGWDTSDWIGHGMQRAGLFGPSQFGLDFNEDLRRGGVGLESAAGPTVQQLLGFIKASAQGSGLGNEFQKAVPGYNLIKPRG